MDNIDKIKFAVVRDGRVDNIALATFDYGTSQGWIPLINKIAHIGDLYSPELDKFTEAILTDVDKWIDIRAQRDTELRNSDSLVLVDIFNSLSQEDQRIISEYRQALRDIPQNFLDVDDIVWPDYPVLSSESE